MSYLSLYRKWRPQTFEDVAGQQHVTRTLQNALSMKRIAHAYLFCGPRGTGKTTIAKLLAKALNCEKGPTPTPCNQCRNCIGVKEGVAMDVFEIDGASNRGIDEIRDLREKVKFAPGEGRYKVYIIDEVHMLTTEAFNALLKTLEEPPAHVIFIFATTEPHKVPATILSRCQRFDFKRISTQEIVDYLAGITAKEGLEVSREALALIARAAEGG
ncbi:MAG: DNA polymerase III subunit gamma/tau, partial [Syntrophothermus sp.]